ncbi:hypothetical protein KKE06_02580, partial [Candidatus Micrarchaeota archaeon]|nr:hypothetical protein [Candidatus Micrarchaeota archaeon]MBU1929902.1 hypothetical protein [Candidatus Micrarchaeota archaeon]
ASDTLRYSLPATINALGNRMTTEKLREAGKEITEIAKAAGTNASYTLRYSLPATINALGNALTVADLRKYGIVVGAREGILRNAVFSISALPKEQIIEVLNDFSKIQKRALELVKGKPIQDSAIDRLVVRSMVGVDDPDNKFGDSKENFDARWKQWVEKNIPPAIVAKNRSFPVTGNFEVTETRLVREKKLNSSFVSSLNRRLVFPSENLQATILTQLAARTGMKYQENFSKEQKNEFVLNVLKSIQNNPQEFDSILRMALPLLPTATGMNFTHLTENPSLEQSQSFLRDAKVFLGVHLPETLSNQGFSSQAVERVKNVFSVERIGSELNKFAKKRTSEKILVRLETTKNVKDAFYDALGQNCICRYGFELERPDFQPIRLTHSETGEQLGVVYALKASINNNPCMILAGIEPAKRFAYAVNTTQFINGLLNNLKVMADENGLTGGVYSNMWKNEHGETSDDGRIAQYDIIREAIKKQAKQTIDLKRNEQIQFPKEFGQPIQYVWRLR